MLKKIWKNRVEFYPYLSLFIFWFLGSFVTSLKVQNRPGITLLGLITFPSIALVAIAAIKTYREISSD